jgi:hypothetical protein
MDDGNVAAHPGSCGSLGEASQAAIADLMKVRRDGVRQLRSGAKPRRIIVR